MRNTGLVFASRGELGIEDLGDPPQPGPGQLLLETLFSGITNGTERHAFLLEHGYGGGRYPSKHGYQQVGRVAVVGKGVTQYSKGDVVFYGGYVGHNGWNIVGENDLLLKLPDDVDPIYCALFGVAGVPLRGVRRMGVAAGDNVWVVGQGPIGHLCAQAARASGARVTVTDLLDLRLAAASKAGAHVVLNAADAGTEAALRAGGPYDYVFDCCSAENLLYQIFEQRLLAHGGTVGLMAVRDTVRYPWSLLHGTEARIETSCHFDKDDLRVLLFLVQQGMVDIEAMVSHAVSIDEAPRMYDMLAHRSGEMLGVIFDWR